MNYRKKIRRDKNAFWFYELTVGKMEKAMSFIGYAWL